MPELPETETIARDLDAAVRGATVGGIEVKRRDVLRGVSPPALAKRVAGRRISGVARRAKSVLFSLDTGDRLVVTPRFTGALLLGGAADGTGDAYTCIVIGLSDGRALRYRDVRRLGTVALYDGPRFGEWSRALGPEPLDPELTAERFSGILRASRRAVKSILMDQARIAGIGNIYANEACWHAGILPSRRGSEVAPSAAARLLESLRSILGEAIALRGTTFRDFRDAYGERGGYAARLAVYGRAGQPCLRCGKALRASHAIDRRATTWCPTCQR